MRCCGTRTGAETEHRRRSGCILCRAWRILTEEAKTPYGDPCVVIPPHIIRKPDPCIYSQFLLMQINQPVTWDNPDVRILRNGVEQSTYDLEAGTEYEVEITVHNTSRERPAFGTTVHVNWIEFGAGAEVRHAVAILVADVPVWPGTAKVSAKWRTPDIPGHYCIEVDLAHPEDGNPANNRGWNNTLVHAAQSAVNRKIRVFNRYPRECPPVREGGGPWLRPHRVLAGWGLLGLGAAPMLHHSAPVRSGGLAGLVLLILAGYAGMVAIGFAAEAAWAALLRRRREQRGTNPRTDRLDCHLVDIKIDSHVFEDAKGKAFDPEKAFVAKPPTWPAKVVPSSFVFLEGEAFRDVELVVDAPDSPGPVGHFNISVWQGGVPSGGVTVKITTGG